jgi:hypothetical protein
MQGSFEKVHPGQKDPGEQKQTILHGRRPQIQKGRGNLAVPGHE